MPGALQTGDHGKARAILPSLVEPLTDAGSNEQKTEAAYLDALVEIAEGSYNAGGHKLTEVRRGAKNSVFPEIAERCRERLDALKAAFAG